MNALIHGSGGIVSVHGVSKSYRKMCEQEPHNIYSERQGPRSAARHAKTPFEIWSLFMTKDIIDVIVLNTNVYIGKIRAKYVRERSAKDTDENERKRVSFKAIDSVLCDLYGTDGTGVEIFSSTMSLQRLRFLLRCLRFDDDATRSERKRQDKLAAIRMVFDTFVRNCTENYMHSAHVTIDEVLVSFKGRCPFRMYIPTKAAKYGIKIFELSDSETYYVFKMEVYVGKQNEGPHQMDTSPAAVVKRLCSAIVGTGRNITMDNCPDTCNSGILSEYFHFYQVVHRKVGELGLKTRYRTEEETKRKIRMLLATALLPVPQIDWYH
ncbi:PiggyBac transposable element-derived protein 4 [Trichinella nelsoni]|uniref:PiggyBac transposable element-derived protein 4 n=2 Tax=Trichinella nelsoni TaxID=6336 RepID=A0A0V0RX10_9BILA|nr:PiggyBac transposable element-derived protein 4 [Trichinella nelsoni]